MSSSNATTGDSSSMRKLQQTEERQSPSASALAMLKWEDGDLPTSPWEYWTERSGHWAPIVDHEHKIILCTITKAACTAWRKFMRRLKGFKDWDTNDERITHNYGGRQSGLTYLSAYSTLEADKLMNDPSYFKAVVVRNPLTRVLSAWKDKYGPNSVHHWGNIKWDKFALNNVHAGG